MFGSVGALAYSLAKRLAVVCTIVSSVHMCNTLVSSAVACAGAGEVNNVPIAIFADVIIQIHVRSASVCDVFFFFLNQSVSFSTALPLVLMLTIS